jgi:MFS family permease
MPTEASQFRWYLAGLASWFTSAGLQMILFPWLVAVVLREPAQRVGIAQMSLMAPAIAFMLLGGAVADHADCRRLLSRYHLLATLPPLALAAIIGHGALGYPILIAFALAMGTLGAFVVPARDALLTRVVSAGRERAIAVTSAAQFMCLLAGIVVAGWAAAIGAEWLLLGQATLLALGALAVSKLGAAPPAVAASGEGRLSAMRDGVREVARSERLFPVVVSMLAVGVLYGGAFAVILPLIVRDIYAGGSAELALVNTAFWLGTIAATMLQIRLGALRRPGRPVVLALAGGAAVLAAMAVPGPLWSFALLCLIWGAGAGVVLTQGRTIVQLGARESHRARVLAIFQLGFAGGSPVGALAIGYIVAVTGPRLAAVYPAAAMVGVLAFLLLRSTLWRQEAASVGAAGVLPS